jgi:hypothetical protein
MPRKSKPEKPATEILAPIPAETLDQIVRDGPLTAEEIETASRFKKALIERALGGELTHHLGSPPEPPSPSSARIIATAPAERLWSPTTGRSRLRSRAIARGPSSRS